MHIKLSDVSKYYYSQGKSTKGIEGVSLDFDTDGSFVAITGESGAGKTTLVKLLTGIEEADEGEIYFDDCALSNLSPSQKQELYSDNISFVFQDYNLVESLTCKENVVLALLKRGYSRKAAEEESLQALKSVGLEKQANTKASKLSGGERQRAAIARSLALDAKVLILDEPTGNLDPQTSKSLIELIGSLKKNRLIIYITHDYSSVSKYVTRHITIADGKVKKDETIGAKDYDGKSGKKIEKTKMKWSSFFLAAYYFAFRRPLRLISTLLVLLVTTAGLLGASFAYTDVLISASSEESKETTAQTYTTQMGNMIKVRKTDASMDSFSPEGDYYKDSGGLISEIGLYYYSSSDFFLFLASSSYSTDGLDSLNSNPFLITPYLPSNCVESNYVDDFSDNDSQVSLVFYKSNNLEYQTDYLAAKKVVGAKVRILLTNRVSPSSKTGNDKAGLTSSIGVNVRSVYVTSDPSFSGSRFYMYGDKTFVDKIYAYEKTGLTNQAGQGSYSSTSTSSYWSIYTSIENLTSLSFSSSMIFKDEADNEYSYNSSLLTSYKSSFVLPKSLENSEASIDIGFMKIKLSDMKSRYTPTYYDDETASNGAGEQYYISKYLVSLYLLDSDSFTSYLFSSIDEAKASYSTAVSQGYQCIYYRSPLSDEEKTSVVNFSYISTNSRLILLLELLAGVFFVFIIGMILRKILAKFYYRKDYDQKVLSYIGYSWLDIFKINLIQFVISELILICLCYPLGILLISPITFDFTVFPHLMIASIFICLVFSVFLSLPSKKERRD